MNRQEQKKVCREKVTFTNRKTAWKRADFLRKHGLFLKPYKCHLLGWRSHYHLTSTTEADLNNRDKQKK